MGAWYVDRTKFHQPKRLLSQIICCFSLLFKWIILLRASVSCLILWNFLLCNWLGIQTLVYWKGTKSICSISRGRIIDRRSQKFDSDSRLYFFCFVVLCFKNSFRNSLWTFATRILFMLCRFPLKRFFMHSHGNRINSFAQHRRKGLSHL